MTSNAYKENSRKWPPKLTQGALPGGVFKRHSQFRRERLAALALPVHHPVVTTEPSPPPTGGGGAADADVVGRVGEWHGGGEGQERIGLDAVEELADLVVDEENRTLTVAQAERQEVDFHFRCAVGGHVDCVARRPERAQHRAAWAWERGI